MIFVSIDQSVGSSSRGYRIHHKIENVPYIGSEIGERNGKTVFITDGQNFYGIERESECLFRLPLRLIFLVLIVINC